LEVDCRHVRFCVLDSRWRVVVWHRFGENLPSNLFHAADVSNPQDVDGLMHKVVETYEQLDCAFNNAGIEGHAAVTPDCTIENWNRVIAINLTGVFLCMKYEIPLMLLTFFRGASIKDPQKLFNSSLEGNVRRAIDFREGEKIDEASFKQLIRAAVAANSAALAQRAARKK
jgi:hypothetical protein